MESADTKNLVEDKVVESIKKHDYEEIVKGNFLEAEDKRDELLFMKNQGVKIKVPKVIQPARQVRLDNVLDCIYQDAVLPCINSIQNCPVEGSPRSVHEHLKTCEFLPNYVCVYPNCPMGPLSCSKLTEHLDQIHGSLILPDYDDDENCPHYIKWEIEDDATEYFSVPLIFNFMQYPFLLMMEVRGEYFYIWMRDLKNVAASKNIKFSLIVKGTPSNGDERWTEVPEPHVKPPVVVDHRKRNSFEMKLVTFRLHHLNYKKPAGFTIWIFPIND